MPGTVRDHVGWVAFGLLLSVGTVVLLGGATFSLTGPATGDEARAGLESPAPLPTPTPTTAPRMVGLVQVPVGADCLACHLTSGGTVGTNPIPALAHPVEGWSDCTACHSADRLVQTAPGHAGLGNNDCLACHKSASLAAPHRPHSTLPNVDCRTCHGTKAPLPASMTKMPGTTCWLCHQSPSAETPTIPHQLVTDRACRSCHTSSLVGSLPVSHNGQSDDTCTLCHEVSPVAAPAAPHDLKSRAGLCSFCHGQAAAAS